MDFYQIKETYSPKTKSIEIYPDFVVCRSKDLMVRGKSFYAIWDEEKGLWSTDEYDVQRLVDRDLDNYKENLLKKGYMLPENIKVKYMGEFSSNSWIVFKNYISHISDSNHVLDDQLTFQNTKVKKTDYVSKRLPYSLEKGDISAYEEMVSTLYDPEEREKIEWAIGSIISGDSKNIQKFLVFHGMAGTGKSTMLSIIEKLFEGYYTTFEAKSLVTSNNIFATESFRNNPLVAIQHDGDLSRIEDNTKLNSIVSHEQMTMNEKYKSNYTSRLNCMLFMGTNKPVKITDAKSGIIRRLIDVKPSGRLLPSSRYDALKIKIDFELGAIAYHCLEVYQQLGKNYYASYKPMDMIFQTDVFFNFVESNYFVFKDQNGVSLTQAYDMYKRYCDEALVDIKMPRHKFREELKNYFETFSEVTRINDKQIRSYYSGFIINKFKSGIQEPENIKIPNWLNFDNISSKLDYVYKNCHAQYADADEKPKNQWDKVTTVLGDLDTKKTHYVKPPSSNHIVVDFDMKDQNGNKSLELNLEAAKKWPPTYAELSKSENGIHLHYLYDGDPNELSSIYDDNIEIKVFNGNASLRRKLSKCNDLDIKTISQDTFTLPLKIKKRGFKMIKQEPVQYEKGLREIIQRNLKKEIHPSTDRKSVV